MLRQQKLLNIMIRGKQYEVSNFYNLKLIQIINIYAQNGYFASQPQQGQIKMKWGKTSEIVRSQINNETVQIQEQSYNMTVHQFIDMVGQGDFASIYLQIFDSKQAKQEQSQKIQQQSCKKDSFLKVPEIYKRQKNQEKKQTISEIIMPSVKQQQPHPRYLSTQQIRESSSSISTCIDIPIDNPSKVQNSPTISLHLLQKIICKIQANHKIQDLLHLLKKDNVPQHLITSVSKLSAAIVQNKKYEESMSQILSELKKNYCNNQSENNQQKQDEEDDCAIILKLIKKMNESIKDTKHENKKLRQDLASKIQELKQSQVKLNKSEILAQTLQFGFSNLKPQESQYLLKNLREYRQPESAEILLNFQQLKKIKYSTFIQVLNQFKEQKNLLLIMQCEEYKVAIFNRDGFACKSYGFISQLNTNVCYKIPDSKIIEIQSQRIEINKELFLVKYGLDTKSPEIKFNPRGTLTISKNFSEFSQIFKNTRFRILAFRLLKIKFANQQ